MVNDRVPYIYIKSLDGTIPKLQGDRIEHPDYIREMNLTPDFMFYITNQLIKPISQLYALCVEKLPGYSYPPEYWIQWDTELCGKELYTNDKKRKDRIQALKMKEVEALLFYPYMVQIDPELGKKKARAPIKRKKTNENGEPVEALPDIELTEESKQIEITLKMLKGGTNSEYEGHIQISESTLPKATIIIDETIKVKGNKDQAHIQTTEKAFKIYFKKFPELKGIPIKLRIDKNFIKKLKNAWERADNIQEELEKALNEQDIEKTKELQSLQQTANILSYFQSAPFVFDPK
jgi:hypothetical protein